MKLTKLTNFSYLIPFSLFFTLASGDVLPASNEATASFVSSPTSLEPVSAFKFNFICNKYSISSILKFELYTSDHVLFTKTYSCFSNSRMTQQLKLKLPDSYVYNYDFHQPWMKFDPQCSASLSISKEVASSFVKAQSVVLPIRPVYERPFKTPDRCLTFIAKIFLELSKQVIPKCPLDNDVLDFLHNPVVFNKEYLGVVKAIPRVNDPDLKYEFEESSNVFSQMTVNLYIYLLDYPEDRAGLFHQMTLGGHIFATAPVLLVMQNGNLFVEIPQRNQLQSFICHTYLSLRQWYYLNLVIDNQRKGTLNICKVTKSGITSDFCTTCIYVLDYIMQYNPYVTSFVVGGSLIFPSPHGYIAGVEIILNKAVSRKERSSKSSPVMDVEIAHFDSQCTKFEEKVRGLMSYYEYELKQKMQDQQCVAIPWKTSDYRQKNVCYEKPKTLLKHNFIQDIIKNDIYGQVKIEVSDLEYLQQVGKKLYLRARAALGIGLHEVKHGLIPYILQASCLGYGIASYMAAVVHYSGFGVPMDELTGSLYLIRSALLNDRLGLLSLGFKYTYGLNGYPIDLPIAWKYYMQAAIMFHEDREAHKESDVVAEHVRLTDKKDLEMYRGKKSDYFEWLKFQAAQGVESAKLELSQALFWGSRGLSRDMATAIQYYRQLADAGDPNGHFDLGIALIRGQGVEQNAQQGLIHLEAAAEKGHQKAVGALGWHHLMKKNYIAAFRYLKMAAEQGDADSMHNLGYLYDRGLIPGGMRNNSEAYVWWIKAARLGQPDSAISVSTGLIYGDGIMIQDPLNGVAWVRGVAEQLSDVGKLLRQGLQAYLDDHFSEALMFYMMAAETGVEVASFNMGYLCENDQLGLVSSYIDSECIYKYYNLSLNSYNPHVYAINKMGDYHFFGCSGRRIDASKAAEYYLWAAQLGDAQAYYNLAYLINLGYDISDILVDSELQIPSNITSSSRSLQLYLFDVCELIEKKATDDESLFSPCMLAKYSWLLGLILEKYWWHIKVVSSVVATAITITLCQFSPRRQTNFRNNELVAGV